MRALCLLLLLSTGCLEWTDQHDPPPGNSCFYDCRAGGQRITGCDAAATTADACASVVSLGYCSAGTVEHVELVSDCGACDPDCAPSWY